MISWRHLNVRNLGCNHLYDDLKRDIVKESLDTFELRRNNAVAKANQR